MVKIVIVISFNHIIHSKRGKTQRVGAGRPTVLTPAEEKEVVITNTCMKFYKNWVMD